MPDSHAPGSKVCAAPADGRHPTVEISATVNGREVVRVVPNHYRLIDFVREELKLTGNKEGCGAGECGTCSMFLDGKLVKSCLTPVQKVDGATVETVDDLDRDQGMTALQRAFHKCGASQCGGSQRQSVGSAAHIAHTLSVACKHFNVSQQMMREANGLRHL